jgi:hypothetical protein
VDSVDDAASKNRVFLLSPASCTGKRAELLLGESASFDLALRVRSPEGAPLGEVFAFLSGLYFRGKLAYAQAFARPPPDAPGLLVITSHRGLVPPEHPVTARDLRGFATVDLDPRDGRYRHPLERDARRLCEALGPKCPIVLLGSIATDKYISVLGEIFGERFHFPAEFAGRGDMSRGGLLLRKVRERCELAYVPVSGAARHGPRPPRLPKTTHKHEQQPEREGPPSPALPERTS